MVARTLVAFALFSGTFVQARQSTVVTGTAIIVGQVTEAGTTRPVSAAIVTATGPGGTLRVMADAEGRFVFRDLDRGSFRIAASKPGWIDGAYGRQRPNGSAQPLEVADGQRVRDVTISLWRPAAITGTVRDEHGDPIVAAEVRALRRAVSAGHPHLMAAGSAATDDRGIYRISSLIPGTYVVLLAPEGVPSPAPMPPDTAARNTWMHPMTFFPTASTSAEAERLTVRSGEERAGVDLQVVVVRAVSVSGRIIGPSGPLTNIVPRLLVETDEIDADYRVGSLTARSDGTFTFFGVSAGRYVIRAEQSGAPASNAPLPLSFNRLPAVLSATRPLWGSLPVQVGDSDVTNLTLALHDGAIVSGRLEFDGALPRPAMDRLQQIPVLLEPAVPSISGIAIRPARVDAEAHFTTSTIGPGRYFVRIGGSPAGWMLKSVVVGGRDIADEPLEIDRDDIDAVVTFTDKSARISGSVTGLSAPHSAASVVIFPADPAYWRDFGSNPRRLKTTRTDAAGRYRIAALPAGRYCVAAVDQEPMDGLLDPDALAALSRVAARVELGEGDQRSLDLRVLVVR